MKTMKRLSVRHILVYSVIFLLGISSGAAIQKTFGMGNLLRAVGIPYPTAASPPRPTAPPVVEIPPAERGSLSLFILAGQSNMVGWAPVAEGEEPDPRIYVFGNDYQWHLASEPVDSAVNQVDQVSLDRVAFFGPSMTFARASLAIQPQLVIGLIPCAKNSSSIIQWQRNLSDQSLYGSCLKRVMAASPMGKVSGILFFQGESDAVDPGLSPDPKPNPHDWSELFTTFVTDLRMDLDEPDLPVVFAQLGSTTSHEAFTNWEVVREEQFSVNIPMTTMITTVDLPTMDGLHFTRESYRVIGERFARAYWDLIRSKNSTE